jgi:hypothetical protein
MRGAGFDRQGWGPGPPPAWFNLAPGWRCARGKDETEGFVCRGWSSGAIDTVSGGILGGQEGPAELSTSFPRIYNSSHEVSIHKPGVNPGAWAYKDDKEAFLGAVIWVILSGLFYLFSVCGTGRHGCGPCLAEQDGGRRRCGGDVGRRFWSLSRLTEAVIPHTPTRHGSPANTDELTIPWDVGRWFG